MNHLGLFVLILCLGAACTTRQEKQRVKNVEQIERATQVGQEATMELTSSLKSELQKAMKEGGPIQAVDYCNTEAIPLTKEVQARLSEGMKIKRTSLKVRNPDNAPDSLEMKILEELQQEVAAGDTLPPYRLVREKRQKANVYHFFKPMKIQSVCVACHGSRDQMAPELTKLLDERYPRDRAVGYEEGELRGVVHVTIPESVVKSR